MKKLITMMAIVTVAGSAMAGLTEFNWSGGAAGTAVAGDVVMTYAGADVAIWEAAILGGGLDFTALSGPIDIQTVVIAPPFAGGTWGTVQITDPTSDRVGLSVIAVIDNNGILECGEFWNVSSIAGPIAELDTSPPGTPQTFSPNAVTVGVQCIPEPATGGLMVLISGGIFFTRRVFMI